MVSDAPQPSPGDRDLHVVLHAWNEATSRLQKTHEALQEEVHQLRVELAAKNCELQRRNRLADLGRMASYMAHEVRNNLVPQDIMKAKEASVHDTTVLDILKQVGSGLFEEVAHRGGLDGSFEALGLSEGQKQIFSVARAIIDNIIKGTKLILVDEATSSVDLATDQKIQSLMKRHFRGCTIMIISHRVETLKDAYAVYSLHRNVIYQ